MTVGHCLTEFLETRKCRGKHLFPGLGGPLVFALQRTRPTSVNTSSCGSHRARLDFEAEMCGLFTKPVGSMRGPFDAPLLRCVPVYRSGLRATSIAHSASVWGGESFC